jgi:hypothetical protein
MVPAVSHGVFVLSKNNEKQNFLNTFNPKRAGGNFQQLYQTLLQNQRQAPEIIFIF